MRIGFGLGQLIAGVTAATAIWLSGTSAMAQPAIYGPGLPMWVVRDNDSTIYITGTVHLLRDEHVWTSPKLEAAFASASELWLELAEIGEPESLQEKANLLLRNRGAFDGPPLSQYLSAEEIAAVASAAQAGGVPDLAVADIEAMQPWMARQLLARGTFAGDYKTQNGIDNALARMAKARGMPIRGMETLEVQIALVATENPEALVGQIRSMLATSPAMRRSMQRVADIAFGGWVAGEMHGAEALMMMQELAAAASGQSMDPLLKDRNEAWAGVIEEMLKGSGVSFIAVGAGHLVGKDSLQERLKLRGIASERY